MPINDKLTIKKFIDRVRQGKKGTKDRIPLCAKEYGKAKPTYGE